MCDDNKMYLDGQEVKVGDRLWSMNEGFFIVTSIRKSSISGPGSWNYDRNGCLAGTSTRVLFWDKVEVVPPPKPKNKVRKIVEGWINIYPDGSVGNTISRSEKDADGRSHEYRAGKALFIHHEYEVEE